jgi:hypothetical protein
MGFRQFSHYFTDIHHALRDDKLDEARGLLTRWRGVPSHELNAEKWRVTIEGADRLASQRVRRSCGLYCSARSARAARRRAAVPTGTACTGTTRMRLANRMAYG